MASGVAVIDAAFVLTWAAETAEVDVPRAFALAVLATIAVTNMTGANRILVGLGWSLIALYAVYRAGKGGDETVTRRDGFLAEAVQLEPRISVEILFLGAATVYAFFVPFGGSINAVDTLVVVYSLSLGSYGVLAFIITAART